MYYFFAVAVCCTTIAVLNAPNAAVAVAIPVLALAAMALIVMNR